MVRGSYALAVLFRDFPDTLFAVKRESPLIVGWGEEENFIASDIPALLKYTRRYSVLEEGDMAVVNADGTVDVKVKVSRGTDNPDYQEALAEAWLFVSENMYVGDFSYSPNYSTRISGAAIGMVQFDQVYTIRTGQPGGYNPAGTYTPFPAFSRKYFLRFGARTTRQFDGTNRYNYTTVKEITTIAR